MPWFLSNAFRLTRHDTTCDSQMQRYGLELRISVFFFVFAFLFCLLTDSQQSIYGGAPLAVITNMCV